MTVPSETVYITTAIPFVNARPHLGFALELCIADALARHARSRGKRVRFATGSDDHSLKNVLAAEQAGLPTAQFVAENSAHFLQLSTALEVSIDTFVATSQHAQHRASVHALWRACAARGDLYRKDYSGLYCVGCERFAEPDETSCPEHAAALERVTENNWFFRLSRYASALRSGIETDQLRITPSSAREETLAWLRQPLPDLCVSRSAARARGWGVAVPEDPEQVIWVWFDALAYYLSALGFGSADVALFEQYWQRQTRRVHVIGKGITRFHALIWPAILASAGLAWPTDLLVHGYLKLDGAKISKSAVALDPLPVLHDFGCAALRYYLLRHVRTTRDADFGLERLERAYDAELASGLGNLVSRVFGLVQRANSGRVPPLGAALAANLELEAAARALPGEVDRAIERFAIDDALAAVFELIAVCNRVVDKSAPWALLRSGAVDQANGVLRSLLEALRVISVELAPFLPQTAARLSAALVAPAAPGTAWNVLRESTQLPASLQLFPRRQPR
jgi:methionyl-tRNA synthetase